MQKINEYFDQEKAKKALEQKPQGAQKENPLSAEDYCLRAEHLLKKRQWNAAQKILQRGLMEVEKTAKAYHFLGLALYHQGFFQASLSKFQRACSMEQKPEYFLNLSIALNELGNYKEAKKAYEKALHLKNQSWKQNWKEEIAENHCKTAELYLKKDQFKPALEEYIKGFQFHQKPKAQLQIAQLLWKLNQKPTAEKYLRSFICLYPQNIKARLLLAEWYFEEKQIAQAVNEWESILKIQPQNTEAHNCLLKIQQMSNFN